MARTTHTQQAKKQKTGNAKSTRQHMIANSAGAISIIQRFEKRFKTSLIDLDDLFEGEPPSRLELKEALELTQ